jgi:hypothetical protein
MQQPYKYYALHNVTHEQRGFNHMWLKPYVPYCEQDNWTIFEDTRYEAKRRLYNYINGIKPVVYNPYAGTEIGKSIPILNFGKLFCPLFFSYL